VTKVGVLALQGAFAKHLESINNCSDAIGLEVKNSGDLNLCDALIIPGGESTVMSKLIDRYDLFDPIRSFISSGAAVWGTCAGMILLASDIEDNVAGVKTFSAIDIKVRRNGYGSQQNSFESVLKFEASNTGEIPAFFIRAPVVTFLGEGVEILSFEKEHLSLLQTTDQRGVPAICRQNNVLVSSFHPELTNDLSLHKYFINMIQES